MKIIKESKEKLPIEFITQFIAKGWEEVGSIKASIEGIKKEFTGTKEIETVLQDLVDAYLIALGQMELHLDKKNYVEIPDKEDLKEALNESSPELAKPIQALKYEGEKCKDDKCCKKTEIFTELPDYDVEVEQKGDKVEIELEPKDFDDSELAMSDEDIARVNEPFEDEWPEPVGDNSDIAEAKAALFANNQILAQNNNIEAPAVEKPINSNINDFADIDFPDAIPDEEADNEINAWKLKNNK